MNWSCSISNLISQLPWQGIMGAIFHAPSIRSREFDRKKISSQDIGVDVSIVFMHSNCAPLILGRRLGMFGVFRNRVLRVLRVVFFLWYVRFFYMCTASNLSRSLHGFTILFVGFRREYILYERFVFAMCRLLWFLEIFGCWGLVFSLRLVSRRALPVGINSLVRRK